jgi:signal transduction histidine kinase
MLGRRIVRPIEALTHAARRMEAGDLAQRVDTASRDEIGALAQAFNAMAQRLAHTETLRRHLVNDVAHELRTPLTNIRCQLEAVQDGLLTPGRETLESLHHEVMLLSRLVDDLQDLALAEAGQLRLDRTAVPVAALMATAAASLAPQAAARGVSLTSAPVAADLQVQADPQRLGQVLRNLIVNAITHTPAGGSIAIAAQSAPAQVAISVTDTGTGIAAEHLPHIFERFYRTDRSRTRATGGAGLGLAIVRQLVETQGGRVSVDSVVDRGSTFTVMLPRADSPGTPAPLPAPAPLGD